MELFLQLKNNHEDCVINLKTPLKRRGFCLSFIVLRVSIVYRMNEKQQMEQNAAEKFLHAYNLNQDSTYFIKSLQDVPDILCTDDEGQILKLEITHTQDRVDDMAVLLGRNKLRSLEYVRSHGMPVASALQGNSTDMLMRTILKKVDSDYGSNVALVIRDVSPLDWDWSLVLQRFKPKLETALSTKNNPFEKGIWLLQYNGDIIRIL